MSYLFSSINNAIFRPCMIILLMIMQGICLCPVTLAANQTVTVEGIAPIIHDDRTQARDGALTDARIRAMETVAGIDIDAHSVFAHELMLDSTMDTSTTGFIQKEKILSESTDQTGMFHVQLEAMVSTEDVKNRLKQLLRSDRIVIMVNEKNLDQPVAMSQLNNRLTQQLNQNGYQQIIQVKNEFGDTFNLSTADLFSIKEAESIGIRHLADIVIAGNVLSRKSSRISDNMFAAHADGWVRVFAVKEGKILTSAYFSAIRGFGPNVSQAGRNALANISDQIVNEVLNHIAQKSLRRINVVIYDIPDFTRFKKYKNMLSLMRWVQKVDSEGFSTAKTVFNLQYAEPPEILASRLSLFKEIAVLKFDNQTIEARVFISTQP